MQKADRWRLVYPSRWYRVGEPMVYQGHVALVTTKIPATPAGVKRYVIMTPPKHKATKEVGPWLMVDEHELKPLLKGI